MPIGTWLWIKIPAGISFKDESNADVLLSIGRLNPLSQDVALDKSNINQGIILLSGLVQSSSNYVIKDWSASIDLIELVNPYSDVLTPSFEFEFLDSSGVLYEYLKTGVTIRSNPNYLSNISVSSSSSKVLSPTNMTFSFKAATYIPLALSPQIRITVPWQIGLSSSVCSVSNVVGIVVTSCNAYQNDIVISISTSSDTISSGEQISLTILNIFVNPDDASLTESFSVKT